MIAHSWQLTVPEGVYVIDGIIYFPEQEEFSSDLLSRHPDCLALPMHEEYVRLYDAHGEEKAEAYLHKISNELTSDILSLDASDEEIRPYARKLADQFTRLPRLFKNPANAARVLSDIAHNKYGVTPPGGNKKQKKQNPLPVTVTGKHNLLIPVTGMNGLNEPLAVTGILARLADEASGVGRYAKSTAGNSNMALSAWDWSTAARASTSVTRL